MRKVAVVLIFLATAMPAVAAKRVTVDQLGQILTAAQGKPDADVAWQISGLMLTERLSSARLGQFQAELVGERAREALTALADESAFLDPPAGEIPQNPVPDLAGQRRIMGLVVSYVGKTIPQLPNFFATRSTKRFEDTPQVQQTDALIPYQPLHLVGNSSATVLYRDGREVADERTGADKKHPAATQGLTTWGVFGPILSTVLLDAAHSKLAWSHWEQGANGLNAVFSFEVPRDQSHYEVNYCCVAEEAATIVANLFPFRRVVGYRGKMTVDPATGTILRLSVQADLKSTDPVVRADIVVDYGPVGIGGKTYFCPQRSVSNTLAQVLQVNQVYGFALSNQVQPIKHLLNDVTFEQYHLFRTDIRVLTPAEAELAAASPAPAPSAKSEETASASATASNDIKPPPSAEDRAAPPEVASASNPATVAGPAPVVERTTASPATVSPEPPAPEFNLGPATGLPDLPASPQPAVAASGFTLRTTARLVDVSVIVVDKKGRPVTDLKPGDFEIDDNGRKQEIRFFSQAGNTTQANPTAPSPPSSGSPEQPEYSNRRAATPLANTTTAATESDSAILLIDASNLAWGDLTYAREEMLRFLKSAPVDEQVGLYVLTSHGFQILEEPISDHARLAATLAKWMPNAQDLARAQDEERRNRQQFDWVHSVYDLRSVNGNGETDPENFESGASSQAAAAAIPTDAELRELGSNPGRDALFLLGAIARHLAAIPNHKTLVWVSSDNVLADWSSQAASREDKGSKFLDPLGLRAQEALNDAHVSIYPLDASQLEGGGIGADIGNRNVLAMGRSDRDTALSAVGDAGNGAAPGRDIARMQQDTHPIAGEYRELAQATGGRTLRRAGNLAAELDGAVADGRAAYLLSFTPDTPADDKYHVLTVKLAGRRNVVERYRAGYLSAKEPATLKDRFGQAIWQPNDANEIAIGANLVADAKGNALRLNIAATDLELAQQGGRWMDKLDIFVVRRDDSALHAVLSGQTLGLRLTPATYQNVLRDGIPFEQRLDANASLGSIRMVVVDENSGRIGSITVPAGAMQH